MKPESGKCEVGERGWKRFDLFLTRKIDDGFQPEKMLLEEVSKTIESVQVR